MSVARGDRSIKGAAIPPLFTDATAGQVPKQCSAEFKRDVVNREISRQVRAQGHRPQGLPLVEQWLGMSTDELQRLRFNRRKYIHNRYPLIELRMTRNDCIRWAEVRQIPRPPKSACVFCPYRHNGQFAAMKADTSSDDWPRVVQFDKAIRTVLPIGQAFVHRSMLPIDEVDLSQPNGDLFDNECEGLCNS